MAAPADPWVAYVANSVVTKQSAPAPVILRADPATGGLTEISRNGPQGDYFRHPYDIAVASDGSLLVADMGAFATSTDHTADGRIIRVDPVTGRQSLVSSGNLLVDPAGLTIGPDGLIYVVENVGTLGTPSVLSVNPATGAQTVVTQGGQLCYPFGIAAEADGSLLVTNYGDFSDDSTVVNCVFDFGALIRIDRATHDQTIVSRNAPEWGNLFRNPIGVTVAPGGRILIVNQNGGTALMAVDPETGVQDEETPNTTTDRVVVPQRPAVTPAGDVVLSDFTLDDQEGGVVSVDLPAGTQSVLRQDRHLFNNPLGVAVVVNRAPVAAVSATPTVVGPGRAVTFNASGSTDPEHQQLRYEWDLDGNGSFETPGGTSPTVTRAYSSSTTLTARVRVMDPHGASGVAGTAVRVDAIRPLLTQLRVSGTSITYRLSEAARVTVKLQSRVGSRRWRSVRTLRQDGKAGKNRLRTKAKAHAARKRKKAKKKRAKKVRYRAEAVAVDVVGNRSTTVRLKVSATAAQRLRRR
jgi:sugar lactone lactonase YvrE